MTDLKLKKVAARLNANLIRKQAGVMADMLGGIPSQMVLGTTGIGSAVGSATAAGGLLHGALSDMPTAEDIKNINKDWGMSFIPGVGASRMLRRMRYNARKAKHGEGNIAGEILPGYLTSTVAGAAGGGLIGAGLGGWLGGKEGAALGGGVGLAAGSLVSAAIAPLAASIAAAITRRRTQQEQLAHDNELNVSNWLIPGVSFYNYWKRIGRLREEQDGAPTEEQVKRENAKNAYKALKQLQKEQFANDPKAKAQLKQFAKDHGMV